MFESFGAQARQVIVHAQQEARRLQHNWIGTEHLLLGVMDVGGSVGELLTAERVGVEDVRRDVEAIIGRAPEPLSPHLPFTPRSRRVLEHSVQEAQQLSQEFVGARHILLGLPCFVRTVSTPAPDPLAETRALPEAGRGHTAGVELSWLGEPTVDALRAGLRTVAPDLAEATIVPRGLEPSGDPQYCKASAVVDGRFVVKFAWARPAALRICHQMQILDALRTAAPRLPLPEVAAVSRDPAMLVLRWVPATPFFEVRHRIGPAEREGVARDLATVLAQLHDPGVLRAVAEGAGPLPKPGAHATTATLRARFGVWVRPDQQDRVLAWCDWADTVLAAQGRTVLVHGDFHGDNHLWDQKTLRLRLVIDLETVGTGEPEFDLRCLPGDCGIELFTATVAHYEKLTGTKLDVDRIMAWHLRTVLGDALWRSEAGIPLPDKRTPVQWVDDLTARFTALGTFG